MVYEGWKIQDYKDNKLVLDKLNILKKYKKAKRDFVRIIQACNNQSKLNIH